MRIDRGLVLALGAAVAVTGACAPAGAGVDAAASLPDVTCVANPIVTGPNTAAAQQALNRALVVQGQAPTLYQTALTEAQAAITAQPTNPYAHYLAGQAYVGLDQYAQAAEAYEQALELCPEFATVVEEDRVAAWQQLFSGGVQAFQAGDTAAAITAWESAAAFYRGTPTAHLNLAIVYGQRGDLERSAARYRDVLVILNELPADTAAAVMQERLEARASALAGLTSLGAQLFEREQFTQAVPIFREVVEVQPFARDAQYNLALALYKMEDWANLVPVARRLVEIDPLNYNAQIILFNAYKSLAEAGVNEQANRQQALAVLEAAEALPVRVEGINLDPGETGTTLTGTAIGTGKVTGPVQLEFTLYGPTGELATERVTVVAPAAEQTVPFEVVLPTTAPATGYRYRVVR